MGFLTNFIGFLGQNYTVQRMNSEFVVFFKVYKDIIQLVKNTKIKGLCFYSMVLSKKKEKAQKNISLRVRVLHPHLPPLPPPPKKKRKEKRRAYIVFV
jgi:hypothetical protein